MEDKNNETEVSFLSEDEKKKLKEEKLKAIKKSFGMLVVVAVCLVSSSFAFFYEDKDSVNINVGVSNGIQISVDAETWKTTINNDDIIDYAYDGNSNQVPNMMSAVSSAGEVDVSTGFMKMFKSLLEMDSSIESGYRIESQRSLETSGTNGDFIAFDLFVLSNEDTAVYLTNSSDVVSSENSCAKDALRVAFLYQGASDNKNGALELKGAESYIVEDQNTNIIWEPNNAKNSSYYAVNQDITKEESVDYMSNGEEFTLITPTIQTPELNSINGSSKTLFNLKQGINKIRIYAWVEGQDSDCSSNITISDIMYNIKISKDAEE